MTEAASIVDNITPLKVDNTIEDKTTLRDCVANAVADYFDNLDGHPGGNLYQMVLQEIEHPLLEQVMRHVSGNQSKAAVLLGLNRGTLRKKLKQYDLHD
ncbi:MAG: DNA-binding transcriptional regulator Fis [Gammaproteobacteria bacterium]|nr:DNA-binding transcriptional regulator Fis [Gammaproteobacteria bacterium]MDH5651887.1 DNA-binding transcriptional regulator Fis [Gammaproteobacteria bacterium]